ncbi:MAG: flagellar protein [Clostridiales bacterium]|nr:flagellar protein [Clostridiales bacterium]
MDIIRKSDFNSIDHVRNTYLNNKSRKASSSNTKESNKPSFSSLLINAKTDLDNSKLKFSKHASLRLDSRNIEISDSQMKRLEEGTKIAKEKGVKDSLVLVDDIAFIVNTKSNTVVTAVNEAEEKVFTNIDGTVII